MNTPHPTAAAAIRKRELPKHTAVWCILSLQLLPLYMMVQMSVKNNTEFLLNPWFPTAPAQWNWANFAYGIKLIGPYLANTVFIATLGALLTLFFAIMAAYFFARYRMPGHNLLWSLFITLMLLPGVANIVPLFTLLKSMNLLNTLWALIILGFAGGQVFNTFILRNFIEDLPKDLFEAAEIDGASHWQQIINVVIPMSAPIIGTLFILSFLHLWNEFMMPLIILSDAQLFTLGVGLIYLDGEYVKQWGQIMAAFLVASIPLIMIFLFCMKLFVRGLTSGAVKG
ncbi:MAG: carbohydrate ABC transporter permease [Verrucomicrobiales bacterium]|jgi:ABC-type glycerol-3-phosphate transport system permease component|nr:carbohydrate ABC transporter permease [Verrucomicrobiales bacterium]